MTYYSTASHAVGGRAVSPRPVTPLATQLPPQTHSEPSTTSQPVSSDTPKCSECERFIIGGKVPSAVIASSIAAAPAPFQSQFSTPSAAAPGSPQPGTLAPLPFHAPYLGIRHVNAPRSYLYQHKTPTSNIQAPKVNLNQPAVPSPLTRPQSGIFAGFKTGSNFRGNCSYLAQLSCPVNVLRAA